MSDARTLALALVLSLTAAAPRAEASPDVWRRSYALEARGDARGALTALEALPDSSSGSLYIFRANK